MVVAFTCIALSSARDRFYVKNSIERWGSCRNVAITDRGGDIAFVGTNKCAYDRIPTSLSKQIDNLNDRAFFINDVQLSEKGRWLISYGDGLMRWHRIPAMLKNCLYELITDRHQIKSITVDFPTAFLPHNIVSAGFNFKSNFLIPLKFRMETSVYTTFLMLTSP